MAVLLLAARGRDFSDILPNLGVMALARYRLLPSLQLLYAQLTQVSSMRHAVDEVYDEFVAAETDKSIPRPISVQSVTPTSPFRWNNNITLCEVLYRYPGTSRPALDGLSVVIPKNTSLGVIGPTGSGKSTFVDLLLGLYYPTAGEILIDGQPLTPTLVPSWRNSIGYVPQDGALFSSMSVRDRLAFALVIRKWETAAIERRVNELAALLGLEKLLSRSPRGLSGGEAQRVALGRALANHPKILCLDEPLSGQLRTRKVTTRDPIATDQQLARHAEGNLPQAAIHNVDPRVRNRSPDGDG